VYWNGSFIGPAVLGTAPINDHYKSGPHISRHYRMVGKQEVVAERIGDFASIEKRKYPHQSLYLLAPYCRTS
jgi:hypothetical protein